MGDAYGALEEFARLYRWARNVLGLSAPEVDGYELWQLAAEAGLGGMLDEEAEIRERAERDRGRGRSGRPDARPGMRGSDVEAEALAALEARGPETVMFPVSVPEGTRVPAAPPAAAPRQVPSGRSGGRNLIAERVAAARGEAAPPVPEPSGARLMDLWGVRPPEEPNGGSPD